MRTACRPSRALTVGVLAALLVIGACSGGDTDPNGPTTTTGAATSTTDAGTVPASAREAAARLRADVEEAQGDLCELLALFRGLRLPRPTSSNEASATVDAVEALLVAMADATPEDRADAGDTLRTVASELRRRAESTGFEPGRLAELGPIINPADPATTRAITALEELARTECTDA